MKRIFISSCDEEDYILFEKTLNAKEIVCDRIDQYDKFGWTVSYLAKIEEKKLRKNGLVADPFLCSFYYFSSLDFCLLHLNVA